MHSVPSTRATASVVADNAFGSFLSGQVRRSTSLATLACLLLASLGATARLEARETVLVRSGANYSYFRGTEEPSPDGAGLASTEWAERDFDDGAWDTGAGPFGYGDRVAILGTQLTDMRNSYVSVYLRTNFNVADRGAISSLNLRADYDDGFVAYLNGVEIVRVGMVGTPPPFGELAASRESTGALTNFPVIDLSPLRNGDNVLAIQAHNTTLASSDLHLNAELVANPAACPSGLTCAYDAATGNVTLSWTNVLPEYDSISIVLNGNEIESDIGGTSITYVDTGAPAGELTYGVIAVDGSNVECPDCEALECTLTVLDEDDVLIPPGEFWTYFKGTEQPPADWAELDFDDAAWLEGQTGIGYGDADDMTVLDDMQNNYASIFTRHIFDVNDASTIRSLILQVVVDDGMVAYVNGTEVGRVNMPAGDVFNTTFATAAIAEGTVQELTIDGNLIESGENIIAVSVHNTTIGSSDLSFIPTLAIGERGAGGDAFRRGDIDNNNQVNLTDAVSLLSHLFQGQPAPACGDAADVDDNGVLNLTDGISLLGHLFRGDPPPPSPGLACGSDPTADGLGPCSTTGC